jgi:glycerophosphoryl diester phosphodiesterase
MWPYPKIIAHRGAGTLAPENTFAALRCGLALDFHAVEFDVMLTADSVPVLMHDPQFGRTIAGTGNVCDETASQLMRRDAGIWFGSQFAGEAVPLLADAIAFCMDNGIWMNIELKPVPGFEAETGHAVARCVQDYLAAHGDLGMPPLFSSFSVEALMAAKDAAPDIARGLLRVHVTGDWHAKLQALDAVALHANEKYLSEAQALAVKQAGYGLFCYTVNDRARAEELLRWGVDAFCTDRLDLFSPAALLQTMRQAPAR